jgi:hypothetical protein
MTQSRSPSLDKETLTGQTQDALNRALEANTQRMTNYHIRRALQYCLIEADGEVVN